MDPQRVSGVVELDLSVAAYIAIQRRDGKSISVQHRDTGSWEWRGPDWVHELSNEALIDKLAAEILNGGVVVILKKKAPRKKFLIEEVEETSKKSKGHDRRSYMERHRF
ncbi:MAG: hypothetical protein ACTSPB_03195 [Candidatus Thorarchaeota archaeon]